MTKFIDKYETAIALTFFLAIPGLTIIRAIIQSI
jgi:hypothetical protein